MRWSLVMVVGVSFAVLTMVSVSPVEATVSGDDGRIAFVSDISGADQIYVVNSDGSGLMQITAFGGEGVDATSIRSVTWSPDGQALAFSRYFVKSAPRPTIWTIDADGTDLRYVTDGASPSWSPDGLSLAFSLGSVGVVNGLDTSVIATLELETGRQAILTDPGTWVHPNNSYTTSDGRPAWTSDGHEILFARYIPGSASRSNTSLGAVDVATLAVRGGGTEVEDWVGLYVERIDGAPGGGLARVSRQLSTMGGWLSVVTEIDEALEAVGGIAPPEGFDSVEALYSPSGERLVVYRQTAGGQGKCGARGLTARTRSK